MSHHALPGPAKAIGSAAEVVAALTTFAVALLALDAAVAKIIRESSILYAAASLGVREKRPYPPEARPLQGEVRLPQLGNRGGSVDQWFVASMDPALQREGWRFSGDEPVVLDKPDPTSAAKHGSRCSVSGPVIVTEHHLVWRGRVGARSGGARVVCVVPVRQAIIESRRSWLTNLRRGLEPRAEPPGPSTALAASARPHS